MMNEEITNTRVAQTESGASFCTPPSSFSTRRILVLGLGNNILSDDGVGLCVVRQVRQQLQDKKGIEVRETSEMGLSLLDFVAGFDDLILVDAIQTNQAAPGFVHEMDGADLKILPGGSPHFLGVGEMLALGRQLGLPVPSRVKVLAIEVEDPFTLATNLTSAVQEALPSIIERVLQTITESTGF